MKLKYGKIIFVSTVVLLMSTLWSCSTFNSLFYVENKYFTPKERGIVDDLALSIDFRRGYDNKIELNYVYAAGKFSQKEYWSRKHLFVQAIRKYKKSTCLGILKKIYQMEKKATIDMKKYKEEEEWDNYTYISKYIIPEIKQFIAIFEYSMKKVWPRSSEEIKAEKLKAEEDALKQ